MLLPVLDTPTTYQSDRVSASANVAVSVLKAECRIETRRVRASPLEDLGRVRGILASGALKSAHDVFNRLCHGIIGCKQDLAFLFHHISTILGLDYR